MNKAILLFILLLVAALPIFCINHMNVLASMTGSFNGCGLGWSLCSLDFNGDGIKDLVALEKNWNPDGVMNFTTGMFGRINFYWGRSNFDNSISANIPGTYQRQYGLGKIFNAGDVNGDGVEDLGYWGSEDLLYKILIFYGRQQPNPTPDRQYYFPSSQYLGLMKVYPLGDVNSDGFADLGVTVKISNTISSIQVIDGYSNSVSNLYNPVGAGVVSAINGIGDVNNDGVDDYHIINPLVEYNNSQKRLSVHFGSSLFPASDSLILSSNTNSLITEHACPLGDINGDGIVDFASFMNSSGVRIWYGNQNLSPQWNTMLPPLITGDTDNYAIVHGDLNNDGFEDLISSNYLYAGQDGRAYVWMGGSNFNNTLDLTLYAPPGVAEKYGWAKAAGDFDNDGFCDAAISQPISDSGPETAPGRIHVYAGNAQLADTTVSNEDEVTPIPPNQYSLEVYPNPIKHNTAELKLDFIGNGYKTINQAQLSICNLKGQSVYQHTLTKAELKAGSLSFPKPSKFSSGVYLLSIKHNGTSLYTIKLSVIR